MNKQQTPGPFDNLKRLHASITADLRIRSTPAPVFTFEEWLAIKRELADAIANATGGAA